MHCCQKPRLLTNCTVLNAYAPVTNSSSVFLLYRPNNVLISKSEKGLENPPSSVTAKSWTNCQVAKHKVPIVLPSEVKKTSADWMKVVGFTEEYYFLHSVRYENGWTPNIQGRCERGRHIYMQQYELYPAWTSPAVETPATENPAGLWEPTAAVTWQLIRHGENRVLTTISNSVFQPRSLSRQAIRAAGNDYFNSTTTFTGKTEHIWKVKIYLAFLVRRKTK